MRSSGVLQDGAWNPDFWLTGWSFTLFGKATGSLLWQWRPLSTGRVFGSGVKNQSNMNTNHNTEKGNFPSLHTRWATGWSYRYCCSLSRNVVRPYAKINKYAGPSKIWKQEAKARQRGASWTAGFPPILKNTQNPGGSGPVHHLICSFIQQIFIEHMLWAGNSEGSRAGIGPCLQVCWGFTNTNRISWKLI